MISFADALPTLDQRLYAWLAEADERRFERAFGAYYALAFPALIRYLARHGRCAPDRVEELAQDALLRFFERVGRERRAASQTLQGVIPRLEPLELSAVHVREVTAWSAELAAFHGAALRCLPLLEADGSCRARVRQLADAIPDLQRRGAAMLGTVRRELWREEGPEAAAARAALIREVAARTERAVAACAVHRGLPRLVEDVQVIAALLPRLRIPTNGYLFEIAFNLYLDDCKRRARRKRGGTGSIRRTDDTHGAGAGGLDDQEAELGAADTARDELELVENREFLEKFYEYLRAPVQHALAAYEAACAAGGGAAERRRLESLRAKFERTMTVLSLVGEGHAQSAIATRMGLSRNQVKYMVEAVQRAYQSFAAAGAENVHVQ